MRRIILSILLFALFVTPAAADNWTNCDDFSSRQDLIESLKNDTGAWAHYDNDGDGVACESTHAVTKAEAPQIFPIDILWTCPDEVNCESSWFVNEEEGTKVFISLSDVSNVDKMYNAQTDQLLGRGYMEITDTAGEEQLDFSNVDSHKTFWNSVSNRIVIIAVKGEQMFLMEYNTLTDDEVNEIMTNAFEKGEVPKELEGYVFDMGQKEEAPDD